MDLNEIKVNGVFTSENLRCYKPDRRFYENILNEIQLPAEEVLFVGDSLTDDISGPQQLGIRSVLLDRNGTFDSRNTSVRPDMIIKSIKEIISGLR
jgi:FMN phosphatase YigB (HAD superfamily)